MTSKLLSLLSIVFLTIILALFTIDKQSFWIAGAQTGTGAETEIPASPLPHIETVQIKIFPEAYWQLIINGKNFNALAGVIKLDNENREIISWDDKKIIIKVPVGSEGGGLYLERPDFQTTSVTFSFDIIPKISDIYPSTIYADSEVTISGYDFGSNKGQLFINSEEITNIISWADYQVKFEIPINAVSGYLKLINLQAELSEDIYIEIYEPPDPQIQYVSPASGFVNDSITIVGSFFGKKIGKVYINEIPAPILSWNDKTIVFKVPEGFSTAMVFIENDFGISNQLPFSIKVMPRIDQIAPTTIIPGKTKVTISGEGFKNNWFIGSNIYFNGIVSTFILEWDDSTIIAIPPDNITAGKISIKVSDIPIVVEGPSYTIKSDVAFITPKEGKIGDTVEIHGSNFGSSEGQVFIGDKSAPIKSWTKSTISIQVPESAVSGKIRIVKQDGSVNDDFDFTVLTKYSSDPKSHLQKYIGKIQANSAWTHTTDSREVIVAVIDEGIDTNHPDLTNNIWQNTKEIPGNDKDDDNNGFIDDANGWNFVDNTNELTPKGPHGTMVAGIIGAQGGNNIGIAGISWTIKLMPIIACREGECSTGKVTDAIYYAVKNGAQIINLSLGGPHFTNTYTDIYDKPIEYAYKKGLLIVASAGNGDLISSEGRNLNINPTSPACNDNGQNMVIGVAAVDLDDKKTNWSDYGSNCVDISAPGRDILTTVPPIFDPDFDKNADIVQFGYDLSHGTSMSAPQVSGALALLKAKHPDWTNAELQSALLNSADNIDLENPAYTEQIGGRLNIIKALEQSKPDVKNGFKINQPVSNEIKETANPVKSDNSSNDLKVSEIKDGTFILSWEIPDDVEKIAYYRIFYKSEIDPDFMSLKNNQENIFQLEPYQTSVKINVKYLLNYVYKVSFYDKNNNKIRSLLTEVKLKPIPQKFSDLPKVHKNYTAISYLKDKRILEGYPDGSFKPKNPVNRAELLKILIGAKGLYIDPEKYKNCFPDVLEEWFALYVCYAKEQQWIAGYPDGYFRPGQTVNKVEAIKMLINTQNILIPYQVGKNPYKDTPKNEWFTPYIQAAKDKNLLEETGDLFAPSEFMTRAGISENIYRVLKDRL